MAFRNWRLGMHIQQDSIAIVALLHERSHWALRRWWRIPLPPGLVRQGMVADVSALGSRLAAWRRELPAQHQVSIAFPAVRTLQKRLPYPQFALREREQATWVASAMSQQLAMPASALCIDYAPTSRDDGWQVTAAGYQCSAGAGRAAAAAGGGHRTGCQCARRLFPLDDCGRPGPGVAG